MTYVEFPLRTNAILNIQNIDRFCFLWIILASIHPVNKDPERVSKYMPYKNELNITDLDFSNGMRITDIDRFEKLNNQLSINVFEYSKDEDNDYKLVPLYISKNIENRKIIDFFYIKTIIYYLGNSMYLSVSMIIALFAEIAYLGIAFNQN